MAERSFSPARTAKTPTIDASTPMARRREREDDTERGIGTDRAERRDAEG